MYIVYTVKLARLRPCETSRRITRLQITNPRGDNLEYWYSFLVFQQNSEYIHVFHSGKPCLTDFSLRSSVNKWAWSKLCGYKIRLCGYMMVNFHLIDMQHLLVTLQYKCSSSTVSTRALMGLSRLYIRDGALLAQRGPTRYNVR